ncbi:cytochrome c biogenesis heme-transporting ATPase CcmA [Ningiella sp. W23]|uniref:cytochrome c biogenesis heme-transporting ATPase CcmA n=1 Tax=Ningiella sp. W23 TaxID=3023715 RepID=UPI0037568E8F
MNVLSATGLTCEKQDRILFEDLSLHINAGDLVLLRGENGAGKTSLLRILVGLSEAQSGNVVICGHDVHRDLNQASLHFIYFGHKLGVSGLLNPIENIAFWCQQHGLKLRHDEILLVLETLGLEGLETLAVKYLSQGQQRKVALAKLWITQSGDSSLYQPKLWVLDEPFTALDVSMVAMVEAKILNFLQSGGCVIMTSHQAVNLAYEQREFSLEYRW